MTSLNISESTPVSTGRYSIGEKLVGIAFHVSLFNSSAELAANHFKLIELTVTEHHKVPNGHTGEDFTYDGYILAGPEGAVFHNQYPAAYYEQMSDHANRSFTQVSPKTTSADFRHYTLFTGFMENFHKDESNPTLAPELKAKVSAMKEALLAKFHEQFPTYELVRQALVWDDVGGTTESYPDIQEYVIVEKAVV